MDEQLEQLKCPICQANLECLYRRHKAAKLGKPKWWAIVHSRHPSDCKLRYENLGEGETQEEAWKSFRENLQQTS